MSYVKLFESILDSTVWQEDLHVKVVWITMLAMKDIDGVVHASIPGLAKRAGVTIAQCEEALAKFLGPDPYSRTKDHNGQRIEEVDGGWEVLNHDKYRDQLDPEDQRDKAAKRQQRRRDRFAEQGLNSRGQATASRASRGIRHAESDTDPDPNRESPEDQATPRPEPQNTLPVASRSPELPEDPERTRSPEEDQGGEPGTHRRFLTPGNVPHTDADRDRRRRKLFNDAWVLCAYEHLRARGEGVDPAARDCWAGEPGANRYERDLLDARIAELTRGDTPDWTAAEAAIRNRVLVAYAEARRTRSLQYCTPPRMWDAKSFAIASAMTPEQAAKPRTGPKLVEQPKRYRLPARDDDMPPLGPDERKGTG